MTAGHTPGTWTVTHTNGSCWVESRDAVICLVPGANLTPEQTSERAYLIASVPELLAERNRLKAANAELAAALEKVAAWELPGVTCEDGQTRSFTVEFGSNGAREFFRDIARAALAKHKKETT